MSNKIGRNELCPCGSGSKYKKCCLQRADPRVIEPHMELMPSFLWKGHRWRTVWNRLYYRRATETFHEFLADLVKLTFGRTWWIQQIKMKPEDRHAAVQWWHAFGEFTKGSERARLEPDGTTYSADASGPVMAMLQLGYDFFCLQARNRLPDFLIERLRRHKSFQGTRYEIAVAAILTRAGFEIEFLDDKEITEKHCEVIATHSGTGLAVGVEAKSRVRQGVLHEKGDFAYSEDARGLEKLLRKACRQKPAALPFLVFLDVNLPPEPGVAAEDKTWVKDVKGMLDRVGDNTPANPDPYAALFVTNFCQHYGWPDQKSYKGEWAMLLPRYTQQRIPHSVLNMIYESTGRDNKIPDEI
jgi:hypothetical protein